MTTWRLRARLGHWFLALLVVLGLLSAAVIVSTIRFASAGSDALFTWQPAQATSQRLLADLVNQETGVRGYLLTGQPVALSPYRTYRAAEHKDLAALTGLIGDAREIGGLLGRFQRSARRWQTDVALPAIRHVRAGARPGTTALDAGQAVFDRVRAASAALTRAIGNRAAAVRASRGRWEVVAGIAIGLAILVLLANGLALWRGLHAWVLRPIERLAQQTRHVASGELRREIDPDGPKELTDLGQDVESMRAEIVRQLARAEEIQDELRRQGEELERSNADLQQFAYVASHDLSEPLRKVSNFCQLLERQYADQLDDRARQYIWFAVDGAKRMQTLITDLLALSRVGRTTDEFLPVPMATVLERALSTLESRIEETGAVIERPDELPTVCGDVTLLTSLLENLLGNALKYRREDVVPIVRLTVDRDGEDWLFTVSDNGIGIDPKYGDRIFAVFQRLHLRDQYGGTGIGLALCRKIVDFHGGRIWLDPVESASGGATFRFTLPVEGEPRAQSAD